MSKKKKVDNDELLRIVAKNAYISTEVLVYFNEEAKNNLDKHTHLSQYLFSSAFRIIYAKFFLVK